MTHTTYYILQERLRNIPVNPLAPEFPFKF